MCGICGLVDIHARQSIDKDILLKMNAMLQVEAVLSGPNPEI